MSSWFIGRPNTISVSPPPGVRLPWWNRTRPRRAATYAGRAVQVIAYNPRYLIITGLALLALTGPVAAGLAFLALTIAFNLWVHFRRTSARQAAVGWWRSNRRYRWKWNRTLRRCGAAKLDVPVPLLLRTRTTTKAGDWLSPFGFPVPIRSHQMLVDKLLVKVPTGLDPSAFHDFRGQLLQWGWRGLATRVYNPNPQNQTVELWNLIEDMLVEPVTPLPQPAPVLPKAGLQMAQIEDGDWWRLKIRGNQAAHVFVCGISGSGKGSYIAALLDRQCEGIQKRLVEAWGIDLQASELGMSRHLFAKERLVFTQAEAVLLLEKAVQVMNSRTYSIFGITRQHQPKPGEPFIELVIDEGLDLLDRGDRVMHRRIVKALEELLRKGRKASIRVSFIAQRAELEIVEIRKLFQIHIAFQLALESDVNMMLGRGAWESGARANEIDLPGVCYIGTERGILRTRFPGFSDEHITALPAAPGNEDSGDLAVAPPAGDEQDIRDIVLIG